MLSVELFVCFGLLSFILFFGGLYLVYAGHSLALLAPIGSVIVMWGLTLLSGFGRVGSQVAVVLSDVVEIVSLPCDPSTAYIMAFLSLGLTISLLIFISQFAADVARSNGELAEEDEV